MESTTTLFEFTSFIHNSMFGAMDSAQKGQNNPHQAWNKYWTLTLDMEVRISATKKSANVIGCNNNSSKPSIVENILIMPTTVFQLGFGPNTSKPKHDNSEKYYIFNHFHECEYL
mgnify:CR=1 FL=1